MFCLICGYLQVSRNGERPKFAKHCITWNTNTIQRFKRYGYCRYLYVATPLSLRVLHNKNNRFHIMLCHCSYTQTVSPPAFILNRFLSFSCQSCLVQSRLSEQQERSSSDISQVNHTSNLHLFFPASAFFLMLVNKSQSKAGLRLCSRSMPEDPLKVETVFSCKCSQTDSLN